MRATRYMPRWCMTSAALVSAVVGYESSLAPVAT